MKQLKLIALALCTLPLCATTYYIDTAGNNACNGTSPTIGASGTCAWQTVAKVNGSTFLAGDSVLFSQGETWLEQLTFPSSGSAGNVITVGSFTGSHGTAQPILNGSNVITGFSGAGPYTATDTTSPNIVFKDNVVLTKATSLGTLATGQWWWATNTLTLFDNPSGHTIEAGTRSSAMIIASHNYITVTGLHFTKSNLLGINMSQTATDHVTLDGITSDYAYQDGFNNVTDAGNIHTNLTVKNSTLANNGSNGLAISYATGMLVTGNTLNGNGYLCSVDDCAGVYTFGVNVVSLTVSNNTVFSNGGTINTSGNGIWIDTAGAGTVVTGNTTYSNHFSGISIEDTNGALVTYNITYSNSNNGIQLNGGTTGWVDNNNLFYQNTAWGNTAYGLACIGNATATTTSNNLWKNNLSIGNTAGALKATSGCDNDTTHGTGNIYTYNGLGVAAASFILWGAVNESTYAAWESAAGSCGGGSCSHSMQANPLFTATGSADFSLTSASPARNFGTFITGISQQVAEFAPDLGALEYTCSYLGSQKKGHLKNRCQITVAP